MQIDIKTLHSRIYPLFFILMGSFWLAACSLPDVDLGGAAGVSGSETVEPVSDPPLLPPSSATPIPAPSGHIAFISERDGIKKLYVMNADGSDQHRLTDLASEDDMPLWSPSGTQIAFVSTVEDNADIYIFDITTGRLSRVTDDSAKDSAPSWSPDGQRLVFESFRDGNWEIYMVNMDGTNPVRLTNDPSGDNSPAWSPDGSRIAFATNRFGNSDIMLMDANGGNLSTLTTSPSPDSDPVWSPDGQSIAFRNWPYNDQASICLVTRDAVNLQCLAENQGENGIPVWSPDGHWLAFYSERGGTSGLDVINMETKALISLFTGSPAKGDPTWLDGVRLVYQADAGGNMEIFVKTVPSDGNTLLTDGEILQLTSQPSYDGDPHWTSN